MTKNREHRDLIKNKVKNRVILSKLQNFLMFYEVLEEIANLSINIMKNIEKTLTEIEICSKKKQFCYWFAFGF